MLHIILMTVLKLQEKREKLRYEMHFEKSLPPCNERKKKKSFHGEFPSPVINFKQLIPEFPILFPEFPQ